MEKTRDFGRIIHRICRKVPLIAWGLLPVIRLKDRLGSGLMHETLRERMAVFPDRPVTPAGRRRLRRDVWYSFLVYDCPVSEYFLYRFDLLSPAGRNEYITEGEKVDVCHALTDEGVREILWDKWRTYQRFRPYYRREALRVDGNTDPADYRRFAEAHPRFIAKPLEESGGLGVAIYDAAQLGTLGIPEALRAGVILEELIEQAPEMARFHPASVNTIRCATFLKEGEVHILFTFLRIGRGGSVVDNGGAGGFIAYVDPGTGLVTTPAGRNEYITEGEKVDVCHALTDEGVREILWDKWRTYQRFRPYYRREALRVDGNTDPADYRRFAEAHPRFIAKPLEESGGLGVAIYDAAQLGTLGIPEALRAGVILEELIEQAPEMARFHPASVNTIRCATFLKEGEVHILFTFLRIGRGGSVVDNGGAGGFIAYVDPGTGLVTTPGRTEYGEEVLYHPDSGVPIPGAQIPRWSELLALAEELARAMPEQPYISWDLALTPDGWVMVEGNSAGQFVGPQLTLRRGIRRQMREFFDLQ